ncbi:RNA polymerase sigma factor (sigma-70 family) [Kibdelosporangium banguiense]|uniref:RNA polymerase sigma factor (Sigma-70 family) n=1 Tax=Kibdelosporangium banguiense TaxID=1365924 RepID=A0ABS4TRV1_9PSEU|nr:sigma-70 family RNA polymerase sigma factor [Kibdelosporangium banguiense]MBP2326606.1 RNA polymerase sigma factor (sigma-70 family) [Kibdelosporangium banguiense]
MRLTNVSNASKSPRPSPDADAADFQSVRPRLFGIAYQMLGRAADAEDVVQDVWLRWQGVDRTLVRDRVAFLVKITTRVTLNVLGSARVRREVLVDRWLPGQVLSPEDPTQATERSADVEQAVLLLLQRLSPTERAVFVLREAFDYPFRDIAETLRISVANARQLGRRARVHLAGPRHEPVHPAARDRLMTAFLNAAQAGTVAHFERLLADDARAQSSRRQLTAQHRAH